MTLWFYFLLAFVSCCIKQILSRQNYFESWFRIEYEDNIEHYIAGVYGNKYAQEEFCEGWVCNQSYIEDFEKQDILNMINDVRVDIASGRHQTIPAGIINMYKLEWSEQLAVFSQMIANICPDSSGPHMFQMYVDQIGEESFCEYCTSSISREGTTAEDMKYYIYQHIYGNALHDFQNFNDDYESIARRCDAYLVGCGFNVRSNETHSTDHFVCTYCGDFTKDCLTVDLSDTCEFDADLPTLCRKKFYENDKNWKPCVFGKTCMPENCSMLYSSAITWRKNTHYFHKLKIIYFLLIVFCKNVFL